VRFVFGDLAFEESAAPEFAVVPLFAVVDEALLSDGVGAALFAGGDAGGVAVVDPDWLVLGGTLVLLRSVHPATANIVEKTTAEIK
jgi:hypothetical protein